VTKGIGRTQPIEWKDAGEQLSNPALKGCHMPDGPGQNISPPGAYLQYNEVSTIRDLSRLSSKRDMFPSTSRSISHTTRLRFACDIY
jgi:hypothetical protein